MISNESQASGLLKELHAAALEYAAMGYPVFPVSISKMPLIKAGHYGASTSTDQINFWFSPSFEHYASIKGLGHPVQPGFGIFDIDPRNGGDVLFEQLVAEHGPLPDTPMQFTGGGGEHYVFRVPEGMKIKRLGKGIDGLNPGKYAIVEPSMHQSGNHYQWEGSSSLLDPEQVVAQAPAWMLEPKESAQAGNVVSFTGGRAEGFMPPDQVMDVRRALSYVDSDDYEDWIHVGQCLHSTDAGSQAFGLWEEWSKGSTKYNPLEARKKWASFRSDRGLGIGSLFSLAQNNGFVNQTDKAAQEHDEIAELVRQANAGELQREQYEGVAPIEAGMRPFPVAMLERLTDLFRSRLHQYSPRAVQAAVLSLASSVCARNYVTTEGHHGHLYLGVTSKSINPLRPMTSICHSVLVQCGQRRMVRGSRFGSPHAIHRMLERHPVCLYVADDYGQMIAQAPRQSSGVLDQALGVIAAIYTGNDIYIDPDADNKNRDELESTIYSPAIAMLALMADDQLPAVLRGSELGRGNVQQMIMVDAGDFIENHAPANLMVSAEMVDHVSRLLTPAGGTELTNLSLSCLPPSPKHTQWGAGASDEMARYDQMIDELSNGDATVRMLARGAKNSMRRTALTLAAWSNPEQPVITVQIAGWCGNYIYDNYSVFLHRFNASSGGGDGKASVMDAVALKFKEAGADGLAVGMLAKRCWAYRQLSKTNRAELIESLIDDKTIVPVAKSARGAKVYGG